MEYLNFNFDKKNIMTSLKKIACVVTAIALFILFIVFIPRSLNRAESNIIKAKSSQYHSYTSYEIYSETNQLVYDSIKLSLVDQVDEYIKSVAPTAALDGLVVVNNCIDYDIDICFVLAQGEIESHFGTRGLARKTNSVFNVYAFDGKAYNQINKNGKYSHPNNCVEPYICLLKRDYFVDGKCEYDMLDNYVNKNGSRYASAENYEDTLHDKMNKIINNTGIDSSFQRLRKQKLILGI